MADAVTQGVADLSVGAETPGTTAAECVAAAQAEVQAVMDEFIAERQALEERMQSKMTSALNKRAAAIKGLTADNEPAGHDGIPDFWFKAVKNHPLLGALVEAHDEPALKHLTNVDWGYMPEMQGFTVAFHFSPNEYFTNEALTITCPVSHLINPFRRASPDLEDLTGSGIDWKEGHDLTQDPNASNEDEADRGSFFRLFEKIDPESMEFEDLDDIRGFQEHLHSILMVAMAVKNQFVPRAYGYYLDEVEDSDSDYMPDSDDDEDDEGDMAALIRQAMGGHMHDLEEGEGDEGDEDDEDDEDNEELRNAIANAFGGQAPGGDASEGTSNNGGQPECKQQ